MCTDLALNNDPSHCKLAQNCGILIKHIFFGNL